MATVQQVEQFLTEFRAWASDQNPILAAILVGSHARGAATADSDVDLVVLAGQPEIYLRNTDWTAMFGVVRHLQVEHYGRVTSIRVRFESDLEVEFGFTDESWLAEPLDEGTLDVLSKGVRAVYERRSPLTSHPYPWMNRRLRRG